MIKFFENIPEVVAVMSEREDGSMKLFRDNNLNLENRANFFEKIGIGKNKIIAAEIVHGTTVAIVDRASAGIILGADGVVTKDENIFLSVTVADCIPVYFYDTENKIIGLVHAGWRGIVGGIIENAVKEILDLGGKVENMKVALGPGINKRHFEIKDDILGNFSDYAEFIIHKENKIFVNLKGIIKQQLKDSNINSENIEDNNQCTMENSRYFSYRRDKPKVTEAMVAIIGVNLQK